MSCFISQCPFCSILKAYVGPWYFYFKTPGMWVVSSINWCILNNWWIVIYKSTNFIISLDFNKTLYLYQLIDGNEEVRRRAGIERELTSRADQRVLRWFGHVERMDEYRMDGPKRVDGGISGGRVLGRPRLDWIDGVKVALGIRGMTV